MFREYLARVERRQIGGEDLACTARSILLFACCAENEESLGPLLLHSAQAARLGGGDSWASLSQPFGSLVENEPAV